ncbi:MAG: T9SS type A sorting domain-containing protein, partial [Candidatus Marinimicrobia bacterium]|nr:T9SS type A sorting domain-containing protein [Candidatus Neomarinimicrobiota bacterium]
SGECFGTAIIDDCGVCDGDGSSCAVYIESEINTTVDESVLDDIETFEESFESFMETELNLPEGSVEVTNVTIVTDSREDVEISIDFTITLTDEEIAETDFTGESDISDALELTETEIEDGGIPEFVDGCTDEAAWNYNIDATINDDSCLYTPSGFEFEQSTMQAFYFIESANIDGDGLIPFEDWIGIFNGDVCVGSYLWEGAFTTVPAMGDDGDALTDGYMQAGDYPTFKIYDASSNMVYGASSSNTLPSWTNFEFYTIDQLVGFLSVSMSLDLHFGANLVSMYTLPEDIGIGNIMASLDANVSGVIGEGIAANRLPTGNWVGSLQEVSPLSGYWIMMNTADEFHLNGSLTDPNSVFSLHYGANLLSYPFEGSASITETLPDGEESFVNGIIGEGVAANQIEPGWWVGSLQTLQGGSGYWFIVDEAFDFSYIPPTAGMARTQMAISPPPAGFEYLQSTQQAFYFINEIEGVKADDWIVAYNGNTIVGSRQWNGQYTDVPAMGYDANLNSAGYCEIGDNIRFKLYQTETGKLLDLHSNEGIQSWSNNGMVSVASMSTVEIPTEISLLSAYPNPFNPSTEIQFTIPVEMDVNVDIVNMQGRHIETLVDKHLLDGYHHLTWNASDHASGVYFVRLNVGGEISVQKILLMK